MSDTIFRLRGIRDPRLAVHATSSMPAWLWSADGTHIIWANPVAARIFGARNAAELADRSIGPADPHRRQVTQLIGRLSQSGATRMERLRGFGATLGQLLTCACALLSFSDGATAILVAAAEPAGRVPPLNERIASLLDAIEMPALAFTPEGAFAGANSAAKYLSTYLTDLAAPGVDATRTLALREGEAHLRMSVCNGSLYRVGAGVETVLVALIDEINLPVQAAAQPAPVVEAAPIAPVIPEAPPVDVAAMAEIVSETREQDIVADQLAEQTPPIETRSIETPSTDATTSPHESHAPQISATLAEMDNRHPSSRRYPLRFMWQMDEDGRFSLGSDEFSRLIGSRTAAAFGRLWSEISDVLGLDPEGKVAAAVSTRDTWSGIVVNWPADGAGARLSVELSGLPVYDRARNFMGYRGFGVCRDLEGLARLAIQRRDEVLYSTSAPVTERCETVTKSDQEADGVITTDMQDIPKDQIQNETIAERAAADTPGNILPFRQPNEPKSPSLTAGESSAFDELARRLSAQLDGSESPTAETLSTDVTSPPNGDAPPAVDATEQPALENPPAFLQPEAPPPRVNSTQDTQLLDRLPLGVLVYRLDRLIYANRAFLDHIGFGGLHELTEAGGLDALFVEPTAAAGDSTSEAGAPVMIASTRPDSARDASNSAPQEARLFAISWDGEPAMALMFSGARAEPAAMPAPLPVPVAPPENVTQAEELSTILDTTAEGIVMFDGLGRILSCNRSAEALFGRSGEEIASLNLIDLFAPESQRSVLDYLESAKGTTIASLFDQGREMLGRVRDGGTIPLSMTIGQTRPDSVRFFAVFRDLSQAKKIEGELLQARRQSERATSARSDILGRISHEVRMPLNAIIGFADVMIEERFGALGNERYVEYMKDIRASGQRVMAIIDDLLDLSRIESGKIELSFANQDLNSLVEQCVAVMQPQANRERIIIRTSLARALPTVKADARALRQITLNLISNSIHLANAGGQVIVSTATTDFGDIVLRVRDTGPGLNDNEIATAMAPFKTATADRISSGDSAVSLSLTKALVEANRAKFHIKSAPHSGTLIEIVFSHASAIA